MNLKSGFKLKLRKNRKTISLTVFDEFDCIETGTYLNAEEARDLANRLHSFAHQLEGHHVFDDYDDD